MRMTITKTKLAEILNRQTPDMRKLMREKTKVPELALSHFLKQPEAEHLNADQLENLTAYHFGQHMNVAYADGQLTLSPKRQEAAAFGTRAPVAKGSPKPANDATVGVNVPAGLRTLAPAKRGRDLPSPDEAKIKARQEQEKREASQARNPLKRVTQAIPLWPTANGA